MKALSKSKRVLIHGVILVLALNLTLWLTGATAAGNPSDDVKGLIQEVQTILQTKSEKSQRIELVEKVAAKHLDFREMSKRCLPSTWGKLNRSQQDEFVKVFSGLLKASYANHLDEFAKTKVEYQGETNKCDGCEVRVVVLRPNDKIPVNFRLLQGPKGWMIYDMVIEGVSLVDNFRNQFSAMIQEFSYNELVSRLKERLAAERHG
ncbi:MAG: ABC transporter substrate-binding protein [Deltaproteobacteria bacterium]|nr:ABC transporter substrate-binding protein [Deltaproteobacteria bacterium]